MSFCITISPIAIGVGICMLIAVCILAVLVTRSLGIRRLRKAKQITIFGKGYRMQIKHRARPYGEFWRFTLEDIAEVPIDYSNADWLDTKEKLDAGELPRTKPYVYGTWPKDLIDFRGSLGEKELWEIYGLLLISNARELEEELFRMIELIRVK